MPDITMCKGDRCPLRDKCFRFTAIPGKHMQAYFTEIPFDAMTLSCRHFMDNSGRLKNQKEIYDPDISR
jgi:hypothetical protein